MYVCYGVMKDKNSSGNVGLVSVEEVGEMTKLVSMNLPIETILRIEEYQKNDLYGRHLNSRTAAVIDLIKVGLWFSTKRKEFESIINNPEVMEELKTQLNEGGLVDYVQRVKTDEFLILWSIFKTEAKARKIV